MKPEDLGFGKRGVKTSELQAKIDDMKPQVILKKYGIHYEDFTDKDKFLNIFKAVEKALELAFKAGLEGGQKKGESFKQGFELGLKGSTANALYTAYEKGFYTCREIALDWAYNHGVDNEIIEEGEKEIQPASFEMVMFGYEAKPNYCNQTTMVLPTRKQN